MPDPHDLHQPTAVMPVVEQRGVYRAANHHRTVLLAAAAAAVVLLALVVRLFSGDDEAPPPPVAAPPAVTTSTASAEPTGDPAEEATTTPPATVSTAVVTVRPARPGQMIAALRAVVDSLEDQDQIDDDGADALNRRLRDAARRLERGKPKEASRKIDEFAKKLAELRKDDDISRSAFSTLAAGAAQIKAALPGA
ncbi:hypothetical protein [Actinoplanes sp. NPDC049802]|uniref:FIMAH domain-containing protein n=1 Tax=Actinoplanes sp. NPDC049802 TaxID=3154742 RepID=UPI0033D05C30